VVDDALVLPTPVPALTAVISGVQVSVTPSLPVTTTGTVTGNEMFDKSAAGSVSNDAENVGPEPDVGVAMMPVGAFTVHR
jgi:hypothetical protein